MKNEFFITLKIPFAKHNPAARQSDDRERKQKQLCLISSSTANMLKKK